MLFNYKRYLGLLLLVTSLASAESVTINGGGSDAWKDPVAVVGDLPPTGNSPGDAIIVVSPLSAYGWDGASWQLLGGGGGGAVTAVFGRTGAVIATAGDYTASLITNVPAGNIAAVQVQAALNELDSEKQALLVNSAGLAAALSDESGTGLAVFNNSPALLGSPTAPTQAALDNSTKIATTAYADASSAAAASASIVQTILNGDTTHASSSDALFDALALKQPNISTSAAVAGQFVTGFTAPNTFTRAVISLSDLPTIQYPNESFVNGFAGSDAGDGSRQHPWATISHACATVVAPAIIHIATRDFSPVPIVCPEDIALVGESSYTIVGQPITITPGAGNTVVKIENLIVNGAVSWIKNDGTSPQMVFMNTIVNDVVTMKQQGVGASAFLYMFNSAMVGLEAQLSQVSLQETNIYGPFNMYDNGLGNQYLIISGGDLFSVVTLEGDIHAYLSGAIAEPGYSLTGVTTAQGTPSITTDASSVPPTIAGAYSIAYLTTNSHYINYDNTISGLSAVLVKTAIDELQAEKQALLVNSAGLAAALSDESGTGLAVFNNSPAFLGSPTAPTQTANDNSTKLATTAYVDTGLALKESLANKDQNNGYAGLDAGGKILVSALPNSVMEFKGQWNANTNTPALANGTGNTGDVYRANVAGTTDFGAGGIAFAVGDWAVYNGTIWEYAANSNTVMSVNGQQGVVVLTTSDIAEGTNLYFTEPRVLGTDLFGFVSGAGVITAADTILSAINKLDGNIAAMVSGVSSVFGRTGVVVAVAGDYTGAQITNVPAGSIAAITTQAAIDELDSEKQPVGNYITALTGDVVATGPGSVAATIQADAVTNAKLADMAAHTIKGNNTAGAANPIDLTAAQFTAELNLFTDLLQGAVPASGGGTANFLRADGVFAPPPAAISSLNALTASTQTFATGTSGLDFNISSVTATHTFNLPDASLTARGVVTIGAQTFAGYKQFDDGIAAGLKFLFGEVVDPLTGTLAVFTPLEPSHAMTNSGLVSIKEIADPEQGKVVSIINNTGVSFTLIHESGAASTAFNRMRMQAGVDLVLGNDQSVQFLYNGNEGRWYQTSGPSATTASAIINVPAGNISATNVQAAINELDSEKQALLVNSAGLAAALSDESGTGLAVFNDSPALIGNPTAPTQTFGDNSTKIATTAFVQAAVSAFNVTVVDGGNAAYAIQASDGHIRSGTTLTADRTYTLPACVANIGERHSVKNLASQGFNIILAGNGGDVIDGVATKTLNPGDSIPVICAVSGVWDIE